MGRARGSPPTAIARRNDPGEPARGVRGATVSTSAFHAWHEEHWPSHLGDS